MRRLIGISGPTASGKTTVAKGLIQFFNADTHRFSAVLAAIARDIGLESEKETLQKLSTALRTHLGEDVLARGMCEWVRKCEGETVVVEGLRRATDIELLENVAKETGRSWTLLYVDADHEIRFSRINERLFNEGKPPIEKSAFRALESQECEVELPRIRQAAHVHLDNTDLTEVEANRKAIACVEMLVD